MAIEDITLNEVPANVKFDADVRAAAVGCHDQVI